VGSYSRCHEIQPLNQIAAFYEISFSGNIGAITINLEVPAAVAGEVISDSGYFFDKKTLFARDSTRSGKPLTQFAGILRLPLKLYVARSGHPIYSGPVVILVGPRSASSSEVFAAGMQDTQRARIVGSATCGCVLGIAKPRKMKGGGVLEMSEVAWFSPKGRKLEGTGITPDEEILPTATDFQMKRDPALLQAEQVLRQMGGERRIARVR